jgi:hypothetical protein
MIWCSTSKVYFVRRIYLLSMYSQSKSTTHNNRQCHNHSQIKHSGKSRRSLKYLRQSVAITGLGSETFKRNIEVINTIQAYLSREFQEDTLIDWTRTDFENMESIEISVRNQHLSHTTCHTSHATCQTQTETLVHQSTVLCSRCGTVGELTRTPSIKFYCVPQPQGLAYLKQRS